MTYFKISPKLFLFGLFGSFFISGNMAKAEMPIPMYNVDKICNEYLGRTENGGKTFLEHRKEREITEAKAQKGGYKPYLESYKAVLRTYNNCIQKFQTSYILLKSVWNKYPDEKKQKCITTLEDNTKPAILKQGLTDYSVNSGNGGAISFPSNFKTDTVWSFLNSCIVYNENKGLEILKFEQ